MTDPLTATISQFSASATKAVDASVQECQRLELALVRTRAALREAIELGRAALNQIDATDEGQQSNIYNAGKRFDELLDFLNGEREGL